MIDDLLSKTPVDSKITFDIWSFCNLYSPRSWKSIRNVTHVWTSNSFPLNLIFNKTDILFLYVTEIPIYSQIPIFQKIILSHSRIRIQIRKLSSSTNFISSQLPNVIFVYSNIEIQRTKLFKNPLDWWFSIETWILLMEYSGILEYQSKIFQHHAGDRSITLVRH
jgi:hypothetical protein